MEVCVFSSLQSVVSLTYLCVSNKFEICSRLIHSVLWKECLHIFNFVNGNLGVPMIVSGCMKAICNLTLYGYSGSRSSWWSRESEEGGRGWKESLLEILLLSLSLHMYNRTLVWRQFSHHSQARLFLWRSFWLYEFLVQPLVYLMQPKERREYIN